jgi:hypothetical protein
VGRATAHDLDHADDGGALLDGCREIDLGPDAPVVVAGRIVDRLLDAPEAGCRGIRRVDHAEPRRARRAAGEDLVVLVVVAVEGFGPVDLGVEGDQRVVVLQSRELHAPEQLVAHEHRERALVREDGRRRRRHDRSAVLGSSRRVDERRPLVDETRVDLAHELAEPLDDVAQLVGARIGGNGLADRTVGVGQVAQHQSFTAGQLIEGDVFRKRHGPLEHVADHRFGAQLEVAHPGLLEANTSNDCVSRSASGFG